MKTGKLLLIDGNKPKTIWNALGDNFLTWRIQNDSSRKMSINNNDFRQAMNTTSASSDRQSFSILNHTAPLWYNRES